MLLTLSTTHTPATDLGYLLAKNPARTHSFTLSFGEAHVFYPEATDERCTAALMLDLDPLALVRAARKNRTDESLLSHYVNDRPYVSSSLTSVAISRVFGSALNGKCRDRPELVDSPLPLEVTVSALPCQGGEPFFRRLFSPLGYELEVEPLPIDPKFPSWGDSPYARVVLRTRCKLQDLLSHLYVLIPVLDTEKHYWVGAVEIEKLVSKAESWLGAHPERDLIVDRYLKRQRHLTRAALARLTSDDDSNPDITEERRQAEEAALEAPLSLNERRISSVCSALKNAGARNILDLGCGEGKLLRALFEDDAFDRIAGTDVSIRSLETAHRRLRLGDLPSARRNRIDLFQGSIVYRDDRFSGYDAACLIEVIEHIDPSRLPALEKVVFGFAAPRTVIVTTPNAEYNCRFANLTAGHMRHRDHRFEWTRAEFEVWSSGVADRNDYRVQLLPVGDAEADVGPPTQMGIFSK